MEWIARVFDFLFTPIVMMVWVPLLAIGYWRHLKRKRALAKERR